MALWQAVTGDHLKPTLRYGLCFALVHALLMVGVAVTLIASHLSEGHPTHSEIARSGVGLMKTIDWPVAGAAEFCTLRIVQSPDPFIRAVADFIAPDFLGLYLGIYWPIMLFLGTVQWATIGFLIRYVSGLLGREPRGQRPHDPPR